MFAFRIPSLRPSSKRLTFNREHWPSLSHRRGKNFLKEKRVVDYLLGDLWCISEREAIWPDKMQQQLQWGRKAAARHLDPFQFPPTQTDVKLFGKWKWQFLMMSWQLESTLFELERESGKFRNANSKYHKPNDRYRNQSTNLPYASRLAPAQHDVVDLALLHLPPLEQAGQLQPQVRLGLLQGVHQQGDWVVGPALQPLGGWKVLLLMYR